MTTVTSVSAAPEPAANPTPETPLLVVEDLAVTYGSRRNPPTVSGINLEVASGETLGVVGESGSGKSTVGRAILGLARASAGRILFDGEDITSASRQRRRQLAHDVQVVFQDPRSSLNEAKPIRHILAEPLVARRTMSRRAALSRAAELLVTVGLEEEHLDRYPRDFSGGQRQRIAIARALMPNPKLIICDEPVSALDLTVQAQIINLFLRLQQDSGVSYLFVAHDLSVVRILARRTAVMAAGRIVEQGDTEQIYEDPQKAYTKRLLAASPWPDPVRQRERRRLWESLVQEPDPAKTPTPLDVATEES